VRESKDVVGDRLRAVLDGPARKSVAAPEPRPEAEPPSEPFADTSPLSWSDLIPSWPDDVDLPAEDEDKSPAPAYAWDPPPPSSMSPSRAAVPDRAVADPVVSQRVVADRVVPDRTFADAAFADSAFAEHEEPREVVNPLGSQGAFGRSAESGRLKLFDPGRRGVKALAAVAVLVIVIAAVLAWRARPRVDPVDIPPVDGQAVAGSTGRTDTASPAARPSAGAEIVVAVGGKVRKPGLVRLPPGSRVADAIQAAGGADTGVDVAALNLARKVVDGELIMVGVTPPPGAVAGAGAAPAGGAPAGGGPPGQVNLNTATLADLDTLPGVGPVLAQRILDARTAQGGFKAVTDLRKVEGIGDSRYEQLKDLVVV
jgi:competence protein ComEA